MKIYKKSKKKYLLANSMAGIFIIVLYILFLFQFWDTLWDTSHLGKGSLYVALFSVPLILPLIMIPNMKKNLKQTLYLYEDYLYFSKYIDRGYEAPLDKKLPYKEVEQIMLKGIVQVPTEAALVLISGNRMLRLDNSFENYMELWTSIVELCRAGNPQVKIDERVCKYVRVS